MPGMLGSGRGLSLLRPRRRAGAESGHHETPVVNGAEAETDEIDYSEEEMNVNYRILADQIGNLLSRISSPRILGKMGPFTPEDKDPAFEASLTGLRDVVCDHMDVYAVSKACDSILEVIASVSTPTHYSTGTLPQGRTEMRTELTLGFLGKSNVDNPSTLGFTKPDKIDRVRLRNLAPEWDLTPAFHAF